MKRILFLLPLLLLFVLPVAVYGADTGLVTCTGVADPGDPKAVACGTCEFVSTIKNVFGFLVTIASIVATIALVYVGLRLVTSGGSSEVKQQVKEMFFNIIIGFILIIAAYAIVDVVMRALLPSDSPLFQGGRWDKIQCITPAESKVNNSSGAQLNAI